MKTVQAWKRIMGEADATHCSNAQAAARCIMDEMNWAGLDDERDDLANALTAYAKLLSDYGVKP